MAVVVAVAGPADGLAATDALIGAGQREAVVVQVGMPTGRLKIVLTTNPPAAGAAPLPGQATGVVAAVRRTRCQRGSG
ncbi:MAG TPA: hypothetical protein VFX16_06245 [Pseudonocardiaceae bacterium]|nr:hypothetical protein [Pseudonocardiaceae bacterium]